MRLKKNMAEQKAHFPTLNAIRFLAACTIVIVHIPVFAEYYGSPILRWEFASHLVFGNGVSAFYILSGFLVTIMLMKAERTRQESNVPFDYKRYVIGRLLRILPQLYLAAIISAILFPFTVTGASLILIGLQLANVVRAFFPFSPINHLWSVSVEEHFFLLLPLMIRIAKRLPVLLTVLFILRVITVLIGAAQPPDTPLYNFLLMYRWESLIIGSLAAYWYTQKHAAVAWIYRHDRLITVLTILTIIFVDGRPLENNIIAYFLNRLLASVILGAFILNAATNPKPLIKLDGPVWDWLARITYGMFAHHVWVIYVVSQIYRPADMNTSVVHSAIFALLVFIGVISVGWLTYTLVEKPAMKLRQRITATKHTLEQSSHAQPDASEAAPALPTQSAN